jgi:protocatechuate 3,4-dioxygenase beta subunit
MDIDDLTKLLPASVSRRRLLGLGLAAAPLAIVASACGDDENQTRSRRSLTSTTAPRPVSPTPACGDDDETPSVEEGPFFESGSPERTNIRDGDGTALVVSGVVMNTQCQTLAGAKLDFWQANNDGEYDTGGNDFRGHQFTDDMGRVRLETIVPPPYGPRTSHIHVKVQPDGGDILTTQLFFPGVAKNDSDDLFNAACLMEVSDVSDGKSATFDFVVEA